MTNSICIGIIGNFTGHLSGAENVAEHDVPNGIFVIHREHEETLSTGQEAKYPPAGSNVDIEPEFVIRFKVRYEGGKVADLEPLQMTIGNDFTIRTLEGSDKISERKAWGEKSKGINTLWWDMKPFTPEHYGKNLKLISYIEREGLFYRSTPLVDCTDTKVFCSDLIDWVVDSINHQSRHGMYEEILPAIIENNFPEELILYTGAPIYTDWGEENFLQRGDKVHIAAYYADKMNIEEVKKMFFNYQHKNNDDILSFVQKII
ncbi:hypothetical protein CSW98_05415 [Vibrio sp. HA2012]|uniref:DUF5718 family protein n=1 Tax=Vibrio sp. HA2012 TaxID=1971595 RepID=UPI000C2B568E|nr:DUF5718 family protein [Vibrio sp. HA2012]PJC87340.1 hypothetical protein CSW98_05415 [Vibrio sp. HA2012]